MNRLQFSLLLGALLLIATGLFYAGRGNVATTNAQVQPTTMRGLIEDLINRRVTVRFEFAEPIAPNERFRDVNSINLQIGDDFVCFIEPWNDDLRYRCTPYSNVTSVTFIE